MASSIGAAGSGIEVMKEIWRQRDGDPEFVFLSADSGVMAEALEAGASAFLVKPASLRNLIDAVEQAPKNKT